MKIAPAPRPFGATSFARTAGLLLALSALAGFRITSLHAQSCLTPPAGLVSWWRAETNALDAVGSNPGTPFNGTTYATGRVGLAFHFGGANDFVQVSDAPDLNPAMLTLEAWVNPSAIQVGGRVVSKDLQSGSCVPPYTVFSLDVRSDRGNRASFFFTLTNDAIQHEVTGTSVIPFNQFTHLAATFDGFTAKMYVNGALENSTSTTGRLRTSTAPVTIGNAGAACRAGFAGLVEFAGLIDEVSLYNRALTAAGIQALFNASSAGKCPGPALQIRALPGAVQLSWTTNVIGYLLETNGTLTLPAGWGVLTSNYSVLSTSYVVTNAVSGDTRFYRLHQP